MATTCDLLDELDLGDIPRILVFNKTDLLDKGEVRRLLLGRNDAAAVSATDRESTRPLLGMIAERLKERWERAAMMPNCEADVEDPAFEDNTSRPRMPRP